MRNSHDRVKRVVVAGVVLAAGAWTIEMLVTGGHDFVVDLWRNDATFTFGAMVCVWGPPSTGGLLASLAAPPAAAVALGMALIRHHRSTAIACAPATVLGLSRERRRPGPR
jgi:hypothetical protein